jgi:hypothetical protein
MQHPFLLFLILLIYAHFRAGVASIRFISGTSHNTISDSPEYISLIKSHLDSDVGSVSQYKSFSTVNRNRLLLQQVTALRFELSRFELSRFKIYLLETQGILLW